MELLAIILKLVLTRWNIDFMNVDYSLELHRNLLQATLYKIIYNSIKLYRLDGKIRKQKYRDVSQLL